MRRLASLTLAVMALITGCGQIQGTALESNINNRVSDQNVVSDSFPASPLVGHSAPSFTLENLGGESTTSLRYLEDKNTRQPILLNAWASWCPPCQRETPVLESMSKKYVGKMQFIGVDMTSDSDSVAAVKTFVKNYRMTYPVLLDLKGTFSRDYKIIGYPTTFIVDSNGYVVNAHIGELTTSQIAQMYEQAIKGISTH